MGRFFQILRLLKQAQPAQKSAAQFLQRPNDLPSIQEFIVPHIDSLGQGEDMKGMFTSDPRTIKIAQSILDHTQQSTESDFFRDKIFSQPDRSTKERGSIKVEISDIRDFPEFRRQYTAKKGSNSMLAVGGPAAEDQTVMASIIPAIRQKLKNIIYLTRDYKESNVNHAAKQSHARHGNALNADEALTGHALLPTLILRKLIGVEPEEAIQSDYKKIDVKFDLDFTKLRIYFGNEINWIKQEYKKYKGDLTEHDINRVEAVLSQEILKIIEKETQLKISGYKTDDIADSSSIHVAFNEKNRREIEHENASFAASGIQSQELTPEEIDFFFPENREIHSAWKYHGDTHIKFDAHDHNKKLAIEKGANWLEGEEVSRILLIQNESGDAEMAGVMTKDGKYIYANKLHFTGGYKVDFSFDKDSETRFQSSFLRNALNSIEDLLDLQKPITNEMTTSTGVSINAIFKKNDRIKNIIEKYGSTGEIAVTNSHWTMIAQDDDHIVMRITGGGNTGSEQYNPAYLLNVLANTRRIFGDDLVGILSTYGCPRAINARNSTEFAKIAEGGIVSYGKGGTGNTKRHAEAAIGLTMLGFDKEVEEYFNKFMGRNDEPLGDKIHEIYRHLLEVNFIHDNLAKVNRRMGYDDSASVEELIITAIFVAAVSFALKQIIEKNEGKVGTSPKPNLTETKPIKITGKENEI